MTDITTIINEAPTYSELAEMAGELAAIVTMINGKLNEHPVLLPDVSPYIRLEPDEVARVRRAISGEWRP